MCPRPLFFFPMPHLRVRLRQVDIKAEHFERQVQRAEQERDDWTRRYEVCGMTIKPRCIPSSHNIASLTVYFTRRKWKANTARRKRTWTSLFRTWKVSNILLLQHDHYTAMSIHGSSSSPRSLSRNACGHSLILLLSYLH